MRLFKYAAVIAVATAGKKFETNEEERACMSACKDRIGCHGYTKSEEGPPECITECREECTAERKENIKSHLSLRTQQKAVLRRTQNKQRRLQHRMGEKNKNPKPNIKEFHQLYEDGEVPRRFIACLKNEREKTNCEGHGKDMWPCKRDMVESCLDRNDDFANLGSARLVVLIQEFREGLKAMRQAQMMNDVQVTTEEPATENPHAIMGVEPNGKNKVKVNSLVKALKQKKEGKVNYLADGKVPEGEKEEEEEPDYEPEYEEEPEEEEERDYEEEPEERPAMQNDWSDLNQIVEWEEPVEPENEERHREAIKNPQALYSYVGNGGSKKVQGGKNNKAQLAKKEPHTKLPFVKRISKDQYITEMCRCRTSMEHFRVKNYLAREKEDELADWKHHDETCKWCAFPNSKKCWQCQVHWKKASDNAESDEQRIRNEQVELACYLYTRSYKNGKFNAMNTPGNDPCPMRNIHHGNYNKWQSEGKFGSYFERYRELHHLHNQQKKKGKKN